MGLRPNTSSAHKRDERQKARRLGKLEVTKTVEEMRVEHQLSILDAELQEMLVRSRERDLQLELEDVLQGVKPHSNNMRFTSASEFAKHVSHLLEELGRSLSDEERKQYDAMHERLIDEAASRHARVTVADDYGDREPLSEQYRPVF